MFEVYAGESTFLVGDLKQLKTLFENFNIVIIMKFIPRLVLK